LTPKTIFVAAPVLCDFARLIEGKIAAVSPRDFEPSFFPETVMFLIQSGADKTQPPWGCFSPRGSKRTIATDM
jgi:hypothetical protein